MTGSGNKLSSKGKGVAVFVDFDGTIARRDVQLAILDRFCPHDWRRIFLDCLAKGQKSRCYLPAWYRGWKVPPEEIIAFIDQEMELDPHFPSFVDYCQRHGYHLEILSDGLDIYIAYVLGKEGLAVPYKVNQVDFSKQGAAIKFANASSCSLCAHCKTASLQEARKDGFTVIYIGDGVSDECPARHADLVFAKDSLLTYCEEHYIPHVPFHTFQDVIEQMPEEAFLKEIPSSPTK